MNKKTNTVLFLLGATVFNLLVMFLLIVISLVLISVIFRDRLSPNVLSIIMIVLFIGSIAGAFYIYNRVLKLISRKIDMDKYFMPLFRRKK